jgi:DNA-binding IscR family transcriptional regulator
MVWAKVGAKIEEALDSISFNDLLYQQDYQRAPVLLRPRKKTALTGKGAC